MNHLKLYEQFSEDIYGEDSEDFYELTPHDLRINDAVEKYGHYLKNTPFKIVNVWEINGKKIYEIKQEFGEIYFEIRERGNGVMLCVIKEEGIDDDETPTENLAMIKLKNIEEALEYIVKYKKI